MDVGWTHGAAHMWDRHQVTAANEALADPLVTLVRDRKLSWLWGANGWPSNTTDRREYMRRRR